MAFCTSLREEGRRRDSSFYSFKVKQVSLGWMDETKYGTIQAKI